MDGEDLVKRAYESILQGDFAQAIHWFEEAISASPDNASYHHKCSITCMRSAKWRKAIRHAEEAVRLDSGNEEYVFHLQTVKARLLLAEAEQTLASAKPDFELAIARLRLAAELDPLLDEAMLMLAASYGAMGRYDEAAAWAKEALRQNPQHGEAKRLFADYNRKRRGKGRKRHAGSQQ